MPRFFFHFVEGQITYDEGEEFPTVDDALRCARTVAWELARDAEPAARLGSSVVVADEHGIELFSIPLREANLPDEGVERTERNR